MTHRIPAAAALVAGSALALALTGCASPEAPAAEGISIVATTTQVADFTEQIAGDAAQVTSLIQPNQSSHSFDPTAADLAALATADVLVINGAGLEEWLENAVEASGFSGTTIDASSGVALREFDDDHAHEGDDPHIWTSVGNAIAMVETIAAGLAEADVESAAVFDANAQAYIAQLEALDAWIIENIESIDPSNRLLVTNHEAFGYFVEAYDITYVGAVIPSFDDNAEVSAADIDSLVSAIRSSGAPAVFSETTLSPAAAETIAAEAGVVVFSGSDGLYGDSLGPVGSAGETYIGSMIHNVTVLVQAWGGSVTPVPAELSE